MKYLDISGIYNTSMKNINASAFYKDNIIIFIITQNLTMNSFLRFIKCTVSNFKSSKCKAFFHVEIIQ